MKYLLILLITIGSMNAQPLQASQGYQSWLDGKQAKCGGRCQGFFERKIRSYFKDDESDPDEEYDSDDEDYYNPDYDEYEEEPDYGD